MSKKNSIREKWVEKAEFICGPKQRNLFEYIKNAVRNNIIEEADLEIQYHLVTDTSKWCLGGIIFQLVDEPPRTKAMHCFKKNIRIIMFMFFRLEDIKTPYDTTKQEAFTVVQCLTEV